MAERVSTLLAIVDGTLTVSKTVRGETVEVAPTIGERLAAWQTLAAYGIGAPKAGDAGDMLGDASPDELSSALVGALRDPAVRAWLAKHQPDGLRALGMLASEATIEAAEG